MKKYPFVNSTFKIFMNNNKQTRYNLLKFMQVRQVIILPLQFKYGVCEVQTNVLNLVD